MRILPPSQFQANPYPVGGKRALLLGQLPAIFGPRLSNGRVAARNLFASLAVPVRDAELKQRAAEDLIVIKSSKRPTVWKVTVVETHILELLKNPSFGATLATGERPAGVRAGDVASIPTSYLPCGTLTPVLEWVGDKRSACLPRGVRLPGAGDSGGHLRYKLDPSPQQWKLFSFVLISSLLLISHRRRHGIFEYSAPSVAGVGPSLLLLSRRALRPARSRSRQLTAETRV